MKKIKLLFLSLMIWALSFGQGINKVYRSSYSEFDGNVWNEKKALYPEDMYITIKDGDIRINNNHQSHFVFYGTPEKNDYDSHSCYTWSCIDDSGKECYFMIKRFRKTDTMTMCFVYSRDGVMFEYIIEKK